MTKEQIKVVYLPNQYDPQKFDEACKQLLRLVALSAKGGKEIAALSN